ncbi:MAG: ABC transporter ATP-binding protein [Lachnospiraceae bacterium]|nr:ABC transporter ATP-binding protein [Lachnospiraceae bacterium]
MQERERLLEIEDLKVEYITDSGVVHAVNGVSFGLDHGEIIGIVGETGAGKTTIALSIMRLLQTPPARMAGGSIRLGGTDILKESKKNMRQIRGKKVSMIFQDPMTALNPLETVGAQVEEVILIHEKLSRVDARKKAVEILEMVGIKGERFQDYPSQFSGGMKQRIVIAIALACRPELLIADEPTTALDVTIQNQVLALIRNLKNELNTSVILITHDLGIVAEMCEKVAVIYAGEIVEFGEIAQIYDHTLHPYTRGLFGSIPNINATADRLQPIPGSMHDPRIEKKGCVFADRCAIRQECCEKEKPELSAAGEGHYVRCFFAS